MPHVGRSAKLRLARGWLGSLEVGSEEVLWVNLKGRRRVLFPPTLAVLLDILLLREEKLKEADAAEVHICCTLMSTT